MEEHLPEPLYAAEGAEFTRGPFCRECVNRCLRRQEELEEAPADRAQLEIARANVAADVECRNDPRPDHPQARQGAAADRPRAHSSK